MRVWGERNIEREESGRVNKKLDRSWGQRKVRGGAVLLGCEPRANRAVWNGVTSTAGGHNHTAELQLTVSVHVTTV